MNTEEQKSKSYYLTQYRGKNRVEYTVEFERVFKPAMMHLGIIGLRLYQEYQQFPNEEYSSELYWESQKFEFVRLRKKSIRTGEKTDTYRLDHSIFSAPSEWLYNFRHLESFYNTIKETRHGEQFEEYCIDVSQDDMELRKELFKIFGRFLRVVTLQELKKNDKFRFNDKIYTVKKKWRSDDSPLRVEENDEEFYHECLEVQAL